MQPCSFTWSEDSLCLVKEDTESPSLPAGSTHCLPFPSLDLAPTSQPPPCNPGSNQPGIRRSEGQLYWEEENPWLFQRPTAQLLSLGCVRCKEDGHVSGSGAQGPQACQNSQARRGCRCVLGL